MTRSVCIVGAPLDTGNLGVTALGESIARGVGRCAPAVQPVVFDNGFGVRCSQLVDGPAIAHVGARRSKRVLRPEAYARMRVDLRLGRVNPAVAAINRALGVLDISGGDSFTDLYGSARFRTVLMPKELTLRLGRPLVLMPQTYGPFRSTRAQRRAEAVLRRADIAIARDDDSAEAMAALLGPAFDPARHRRGVDVAFALPAQDPPDDVVVQLRKLRRHGPLVGLNVSGLLYNDAAAGARFGLRLEYRTLVIELVRALLSADPDVRVVLVPHVLGGSTHVECDPAANRELMAALGRSDDRVMALGGSLSACQTKSVISSLDWFCGTRMHSTIAALSSGVPAAAIAYSPKAAGVFGTCGRRDQVFDARAMPAEEIIEGLVDSFRQRGRRTPNELAMVRAVVAEAHRQLDAVMTHLEAARSRDGRAVE